MMKNSPQTCEIFTMMQFKIDLTVTTIFFCFDAQMPLYKNSVFPRGEGRQEAAVLGIVFRFRAIRRLPSVGIIRDNLHKLLPKVDFCLVYIYYICTIYQQLGSNRD